MTRPASPASHGTLSALQVLRGVAALSVVFQHVPFIGLGSFGVDVFFIISGFIISYVTAIDAKGFMFKRVARIVPLYWLATVGVFFVALVLPSVLNSTQADLGNLLKSLFFIPYVKANGATHPMLFLGWTLNYEMFFYVIFFVGLKLGGGRALKSGAITSALLAGIVTAGWVLAPESVILSFYSGPILLEFIFGIAAYHAWTHWRGAFTSAPVWAGAGLALVSLATLFAVQDLLGTQAVAGRVIWFGLPALAFFAAMLSLEGKVGWPKPAVWVGDISFSLYLLHPYLLQLIDKKVQSLEAFTLTSAPLAALGVLACLMLAHVSYTLVERPSNRILRRVFIRA